jgi:hypothetical protein
MKETITINHGDKTYTLLRDAYADNFASDVRYVAPAICTADPIDEDGYQQAYHVIWDILPDIDPGYADDESNLCDWDKPTEVVPYGYYSVAEKRFG